MSQNLWIEFDKRIAALGTKADELDTIKGRLEGIPQRLINVKAQVKILRESAQGIASKSVKTQIQKDISEKVKTLDNIFKKLEKTKTTSEPMLGNLEKALVDLENYTNTNGINSSPENTPEMNKPNRNGPLPGWESKNRRPPPPPPFPRTNNPQFPNNNSSQLSSKVSPNQVAGPFQVKPEDLDRTRLKTAPPPRLTKVSPNQGVGPFQVKPGDLDRTRLKTTPPPRLTKVSPNQGVGPFQVKPGDLDQTRLKKPIPLAPKNTQGPGQTELKEKVEERKSRKKQSNAIKDRPPWNSSQKPKDRLGGFYSSKKYSKDKYNSKGKMTRKGKKYSNSKKPKKNKFGYNKKTRNNKYNN
mgnify:CR=1 FL=1